ncbi:hypothetical protein UCDDA912_g02043 [Diaporthe ampelina]|uniref:Tat pathway signal sequence n=1 Tax=Diaporthe ampelina TaxID=1214573 RepID=A0A0G2FVD2_9PEZI|nr:hypothetical protein UCDDA912_g02043 [Diaporthe ampelina]
MEDAECSSVSEYLLTEKDDAFVYPQSTPRGSHCLLCSTVLLLITSLAVNTYLLVRPTSYCPSPYASLKPTLQVPFEWSTEYAATNLTAAGELWDGISFDVGFVALDNDWTAAHGLIQAQPFPWDKSKGLYVLNGFHALHCLKNIHRAVREYELGLPQSLTLMHITHCLDSLRGDILCQADDTPRYTTITKSPESAVGQLRQCRDWGALERWAEERTSCYHYISHEADFINQFERFKYCPKDSPYWPALREHFGKPDGWFGEGCTKGKLGVEC